MDEINPGDHDERDLENGPGFEIDEAFVNYLRSLGYDQESMVALTATHCTIITATKLIRRNQIPLSGDGIKHLGVCGEDELLEHDDVLLPAWKDFAKALASVPVQPKGNIYLSFTSVQLNQVVSGALVESFNTFPLQTLVLRGNDLGIGGFKFVTDVLRNNFSLENLIIYDDRIRSTHDAICLMKAVTEHPNVDALILGNCGIGQNNGILEAVIPAASNLREVCLINNAIGSYGAGVIATCLALNPVIEELELSSNNLDNEDSANIALSLKTNSILRYLKVDGNRFTQYGVLAFIVAVRDISSLNKCSRSNHTCNIDVGEDYGFNGSFLSGANKFNGPMVNKKLKLMSMVEINFHHINNIPLEMMPKVLDFLQGEGLMKPSRYRLGKLFEVIREWSMPLLYTGHVYH